MPAISPMSSSTSCWCASCFICRRSKPPFASSTPMQARFSEKVLPLLAPYLDIVRAFNSGAELAAYPGSPLIARALLRLQDRLTACELEPGARKELIDALRRDAQARVVDVDGWTALSAFVPPKERRGLVLIDPPFEAKDEFEQLAAGFRAAFQ